MNPFKDVQKNMLRAWNFTIYKLHHRYFDNNLQKNVQTNTADTFDSCFNGGLILRQLTELKFKMIPSLLGVREIFPLEF